jgi:hypothetical protein
MLGRSVSLFDNLVTEIPMITYEIRPADKPIMPVQGVACCHVSAVLIVRYTVRSGRFVCLRTDCLK